MFCPCVSFVTIVRSYVPYVMQRWCYFPDLRNFWWEFWHSPCVPGTYAAVPWSLRIEGRGKWSTSVRWNDLCWVMWERGIDPTKVLCNCRKNVQLQFNFTTAKKCTTAISFHNCKILRRNNRIKFTTAFTTAKKLHNCKTNAQQQKNCTTAKQIYCILMRRHLHDTLRGKP